MSKKNRNNRWRCPRCGGKKVKALNSKKEELILECKRHDCQHKWHIPKGMPKMRMALTDKDLKYEEIKKEDTKEVSETIQPAQAPTEGVKIDMSGF